MESRDINRGAEQANVRASDPLVVADPQVVSWDDEADVIVVGCGGAGMVAALEAREQGADVLAIDRFSGGGATAFSGGVIYACGTRHQRAAGFHDSPEEMFKYLAAEGTAVSERTLRRFCEGSNADLEWLEKLGVPYGGNAFLDKTAFPPDGYWLYYTGNEVLPEFRARAAPAPRGHRPVTTGFGGGLYYDRLCAAARGQGIRLKSHSPARRLILDNAGAVLGVEVAVIPQKFWQRHQSLYAQVNPWRPLNTGRAERAIRSARLLESRAGQKQLLRARSGVILAAGGFTYNLEMLGRFRPDLAQAYRGLLRLGSMGCDGSGIELGTSAGGTTSLMQNSYLGRPLAPPESYLYGLLVNSEGRRFVNEDASQTIFGEALARQPNQGRAWLILGRKGFWSAVRQSLFPGKGLFWLWGAPALLNLLFGGTRRAARLEKLAKKCGIAPAGLLQTVAEIEAQARAGMGDRLGKAPDKFKGIGAGPYHAINFTLANRFGPTFFFTLGGLAVDEDTGNVRDHGGAPIPGLYAAGRSAVGLCSRGYVTGLSIADTVFSGRRAGRHATRNLRMDGQSRGTHD